MRGCHGKLCTNLAATQVTRTSEHADGRDPRPVTEVYDELPSNAFTIRVYSNVGQAQSRQ
ncbi:hypothetical protein T06_3078 [Trichinella sp. T6]|nr:hypothetical protein T06_3078 [Trichinella sp. T6]